MLEAVFSCTDDCWASVDCVIGMFGCFLPVVGVGGRTLAIFTLKT